MADVVKAEGLVIAATYSDGSVYPFACAKNSTINIVRDSIELAPKTNGYYREYLKGRSSFTVSGNGLVKIPFENSMNPIAFFDTFITATDNTFKAYLDIIDTSNNYKVYKFDCFVSSLTLDSTYGQIPSYSYTLQGAGPMELINVTDQYVVSGGTITARSTATYKLVAVGYGGKWYFNYSVSAGPVINLGSALNGTMVTACYLAI